MRLPNHMHPMPKNLKFLPLLTVAVISSSYLWAEVSDLGVELDPKLAVNAAKAVTLVRIRPPQLSKSPPPPPPVPLSATLQQHVDTLDVREHVVLNLTATVYLFGEQTITELRWRNEETGNLEYVAYSNADFRLLTQLHKLETETTVYSWFPFVSAYTLADWSEASAVRSALPAGLSFNSADVEFFVEAGVKDMAEHEATLAGLDYLHAYYQLHYAELRSAHEKQEAENAAREEELGQNPPITSDATLRWWPLSAQPSQSAQR